MKKIIFALIFISLTCSADVPKFHFMDCIKVTDGFYEGCKGTVTDYVQRVGYTYGRYEVNISDCKGGSHIDLFDEWELKRSKGCTM